MRNPRRPKVHAGLVEQPCLSSQRQNSRWSRYFEGKFCRAQEAACQHHSVHYLPSCLQSPPELLDTIAHSREPSLICCMIVGLLLFVTEDQSCFLQSGTILTSSKAARWEPPAPVELRNQSCWVSASLRTAWFRRLGSFCIHHLFLYALNSSSSEEAVQCSQLSRDSWVKLWRSSYIIRQG